MSKQGLPWYHREPHAYLGGVRGLPARQIAVYDIVLDLIYANGGSCANDPKWISGWIGDMGPDAVRFAIKQLCGMPGKLAIEGDQLVNPRALEETETSRTLSERRTNAGRTGGQHSGKVRRLTKKIKDLEEALASAANEQTRLDSAESKDSDGEPSLKDIIFDKGLKFLVGQGMTEKSARSMLGKWRKDRKKYGGDLEVLQALGNAQREGALDPVSFVAGVFRAAGKKAQGGEGLTDEQRDRAAKLKRDKKESKK